MTVLAVVRVPFELPQPTGSSGPYVAHRATSILAQPSSRFPYEATLFLLETPKATFLELCYAKWCVFSSAFVIWGVLHSSGRFVDWRCEAKCFVRYVCWGHCRFGRGVVPRASVLLEYYYRHCVARIVLYSNFSPSTCQRRCRGGWSFLSLPSVLVCHGQPPFSWIIFFCLSCNFTRKTRQATQEQSSLRLNTNLPPKR